MEISDSKLSVSQEVFVERKEYMTAFRAWIDYEARTHAGDVLFGDTESIYGTGKTTILRRLYAEYGAKRDWIAIWLELDKYSLYNHNIGNWDSVEAHLLNLYDYRILLEALAQKLSHEDKFAHADFEQQVRKRLEQISDEKFISFFEKLTVELSGGNASGGQVNFALDPQAVNKDSWPDMRRLAIENSQFTIGGTTFNINNLNIDIQTRIKELVRSTIHEFTEAFKQLYNALGVQQHNVLFGDDYCQLHGQPIAKWFLDLASELHNTIPVLSRTVTGPLPDTVLHRSKVLKLGNFDKSETLEYLKKKLILESIPEKLLDQIFQFSAGNPLAVGLAAHLLAGQDLQDESRVNELLRIFKQMPPATLDDISHSDSYLAQRVNVLLDHIRDARRYSKLLIDMIDICSILREFDYEIIEDMLIKRGALEKEGTEEFQRTFAQLRRFSFVENTSSPKGMPFRIHTFVRDILSQRLSEQNVTLFEELHQAAQEFYDQKLDDYSRTHEDDSEYQKLYRFEDERWQTQVTEWLYHTSMLPDTAAFRKAEIKLATLYFESFQWWGWFLPSELCDRLLKQWETTMEKRRGQNTEGEKLGKLLRSFHESYPVNSRSFDKPDGSHWMKVRIALEPMLNTLKLNRPELDESERHLRALILEYKAHSLLYSGRERDLDAAEKLYHEIKELYAGTDSFNQTWMSSYLGEIYLRQKKYATALEVLAESTSVAAEEGDNDIAEQDNEILSHNFCMTGDAYWEQDNYPEAFSAYNKAMFFAFAFQWYPEAPDIYTVKWYYVARNHIVKRLIALYHEQQQPELAQKFARCLHDYWNVYWDYYFMDGHDISGLPQYLADKDTDNLMKVLFPAEPEEEDLNDGTPERLVIVSTSDKLGFAHIVVDSLFQDMESLSWDCDE